MNTENLSTLKIHKLSQEQYNRELEDGNIDSTALYLTPETIATPSADGLMSSIDKAKLDAYAPSKIIIHPSTTSLPEVVEGAILIAYDM